MNSNTECDDCHKSISITGLRIKAATDRLETYFYLLRFFLVFPAGGPFLVGLTTPLKNRTKITRKLLTLSFHNTWKTMKLCTVPVISTEMIP